MTTTYAWAPITKVEDEPDGTILVHGAATDTALDRDQQRMDQGWLDKAMPQWMAEGGNIREQHDPKRAVGVGVGLHKDEGSGAWMLTSRVVDPVAILKVKTGVLKGYSIGVKDPHLTFGKADAPMGLIDGGTVCETSLADRPSNPGTYFTLAKADAAGELVAVEEPELVEDEGEPEVDAEATALAEADTGKLDTITLRLDGDPSAEILKFFTARAGVTPTPPEEPNVTQPATPPAAVTPDAAKTDTPDLTKANTQVADMVKAAVAEAVKPLQDQLELVKADLVKALELPVAGGPAATRNASQALAARGKDAAQLRAEAADLLVKADAVRREDPTASIGYRDRAAELLAKADA